MRKIVYFILIATLVSCGSATKKNETTENTAKKYEEVKNEVDTMSLKKTNFNQQVVCNGKLKAITKSDLRFKSGGIIDYISVHNGSEIKKGDLLASLDKAEALIQYDKAEKQLDKARIDLNDNLIGQGYGTDTTDVPKLMLKNAKIKTGYDNAVENVNDAKRKLEEMDLKAPFSGKIANLDSKIHQQSADKLCTLIDDSSFDVEFCLLEAEMFQVKKGQTVLISPFINPNDKYDGIVTEINPCIDDKGQMLIRAKVSNRNGELIEGMNVKILLENTVKDKYVVPKDAVVLRDNYYVVFRYVDGVAVWTYVDVAMSNIDTHVITGNEKKQTKISDNDIIITSGNLNLADGTKVIPKTSKK